MKQPAVYMMANRRNGAIYTGVTSNLFRRALQHRSGEGSTFTRKFGCKTLVYYELYDDMLAAITREKQIKNGSRKKKIELINSLNHDWVDLYRIITS